MVELGKRAFFVLLLVGCGDSWEYEDQGTLSFWSESSGALHVKVSFPQCLVGCQEATETWCSVSEKNGTIHVESYLKVEQSSWDPCADMCSYASVECEMGPLANGTYAVMHGSEEANSVTIPTQRNSL
jgi:hypothetical protein